MLKYCGKIIINEYSYTLSIIIIQKIISIHLFRGAQTEGILLSYTDSALKEILSDLIYNIDMFDIYQDGFVCKNYKYNDFDVIFSKINI